MKSIKLVMVKLYTPCSTTVPPSKTIHVAYILTEAYSSNNLAKIKYGEDCLKDGQKNVINWPPLEMSTVVKNKARGLQYETEKSK